MYNLYDTGISPEFILKILCLLLIVIMLNGRSGLHFHQLVIVQSGDTV